MHDEESQIIKFSMGQYDKRTVNGNVSKSESAPARTSGWSGLALQTFPFTVRMSYCRMENLMICDSSSCIVF